MPPALANARSLSQSLRRLVALLQQVPQVLLAFRPIGQRRRIFRERMARQFSIAFLGSIELDPEIRNGGDTGLPVALAGEGSPRGDQFFKVAEKVAKLAIAQSANTRDVLEIS